ncbi:MAG: glutamine synthetase family protein [Pseudomonadota bacterium]
MKTLDILVPTLAGPLRGKRIAYDYRNSFVKKRLCLPISTLFLDITGMNCESLPYGADGDPDCAITPIGEEFAGFAQDRMQQFGQMLDAKGEEHPSNPRVILQNIADRLQARGWQITVACELEFYMLRSADPLQAYGDSGDCANVNCYALDDLEAVEKILRMIELIAAAQSLPIPAITSEYSSGQFEINLHYQTDAVRACDHAVLLKRLIKHCASHYGMEACFLPKPFQNRSGSGLHYHVGLRDNAGANIMAGDISDPVTGLSVSEVFLHALAGMQTLAKESMLLFAPFANSYRRLGGVYTPIRVDYGYDDRRVTLRVPKIHDPQDLRMEHRITGADANPYLGLAAILAAMDYGIEKRLSPKRRAPVLTKRWADALGDFASAKILPSYFDAQTYHDITQMGHHHFDSYHRLIPDLDIRLYNRHV